MIRVAVVGLGKMGVSHLAIVNAHDRARVVAVCDSTRYILDVLNKYTGIRVFTDYSKMLEEVELDAVIIATPSRLHAPMVEAALFKGLHVFCEKPFCLDPEDAERLARLAGERGLVNQVGYHYRFVAAFQEMQRLLAAGAIGRVSHVLAEAYGPVVLKPRGSTWRTRRTEGGGCLYDYAAHPINLLTWFFGSPEKVGGSILGKVFSRDAEDEVYSTLYFDSTLSAQLSVNWSDESYRKMSTRITAWGDSGRVIADRQECQVYLREVRAPDLPYQRGWNVRYTTDLTTPVWFYVRGEEYSAQIDYFVSAISDGYSDNLNDFISASQTDRIMAMIVSDARGQSPGGRRAPESRRRFGNSLFSR